MTSTSSGPSRRTLVKGAAWSVPVVAVAGAAPAMAMSQDVTFTNLGQACKLPGASCQREVGVTKGYVVAMRFCTTVRGTVTIDFGTAVGTLCGASRTWSVGPDPLIMTGSPDGSEVCSNVFLGLEGEPDSANCAIFGTASFSWSSDQGLSGIGTLTFSAPSTPPCDKCEPPAPGTASTTSTEEQAPQQQSTVLEPAPANEEPAPAAPESAPAGTTDEAATTSAP